MVKSGLQLRKLFELNHDFVFRSNKKGDIGNDIALMKESK